MHLVLAAAQNLGEYLDRQLTRREADDVERRQRFATHRVDVGQRVRRSNLPEEVGIVDDRGEEVDRLDQREIVGQRKDPRIVEGLAPDNEARIRSNGDSFQRARQVTRTQLGGSTRAARE